MTFLLLFWITTHLISLSVGDEYMVEGSHMLGVRDMLRQAEESIEELRRYKEMKDRLEWENNPLAPLAEEIAKDSFIVELQHLNEQIYDNFTDLSKALKFHPADYNCGKDFDIFKLMNQVMSTRNVTTEAPKCIEDFMNGESSCPSSTGPTAGSTNGAASQTTLSTSNPTTPSTTPKLKSLKKVDLSRKIPDAMAKVNTTSMGKTQKIPEQQANKDLHTSDLKNKEPIQVIQHPKSQPVQQSPVLNPIRPTGSVNKNKIPPPNPVVAKHPLASSSMEDELDSLDSNLNEGIPDQNKIQYEDTDPDINVEKDNNFEEQNESESPVEYIYEK